MKGKNDSVLLLAKILGSPPPSFLMSLHCKIFLKIWLYPFKVSVGGYPRCPDYHDMIWVMAAKNHPSPTLRKKKENQNVSPRRAVWLSITLLSMEPHFGATLQGWAVSKQKKVRFGSHFTTSAILELHLTRDCFGAMFDRGSITVQDLLKFVFQVLMKMRITLWTLWDIAKSFQPAFLLTTMLIEIHGACP